MEEGGGKKGARVDLSVAFPFSSHPPAVPGVAAAAERVGAHADPCGSTHQPPVLCSWGVFGPTSYMFLARLEKIECPYSENEHSGIGFDTALSLHHTDML